MLLSFYTKITRVIMKLDEWHRIRNGGLKSMAKKIIGVIAVICGGIGIGVLVKKIVDKKRKETDETIKENREAEQLKEALAENEEMSNKLFGKKYVTINTTAEE